MLSALLAQVAPQTLPDPNSFSSIGWAVVILFALVAGLRQAIGLWRDATRKDPADHVTYASRAALETLEANHAKELAALAERINGLAAASANSREKIYHGLNDLATTQAAIQATLTATSQHLIRLETKIDRTNERLTDKH